MASLLATPSSSTSVQTTSNSRIYFAHLDGLRFWAFFAVFLLHDLITIPGRMSQSPVFANIGRVAIVGILGVNFFFVLSGFLITYLLLVERQNTGRIDIVAFYVRRALRIWPLYFVCVFIAYAFHLGLHRGAKPPLTGLLTFTVNFATIHSFALPVAQQEHAAPLAPWLWSVGVEEQFYLVWPLLMALVLRRAFSSDKRLLNIGWFFGAVCATSLSSRIWWRDNPNVLYLHTLCVVGDLAVGGWAAWNCFSKPRFVAWLETLSRPFIIAGYLLLLAAIVIHVWTLKNDWAQALGKPILATLFAFVILEQCYARHSFYKCGNAHWLSRLGTYTYGLYCLHMFCIIGVSRILSGLRLDQSWWQFLLLRTPLSLLISLGVAMLSYRFLEQPFLRLKRRFAHVQTT